MFSSSRGVFNISNNSMRKETRSQWRLKPLRSEPRICLPENENKEKKSFSKIASSGTFSCNCFIKF